jgi:predicted nuclease of predicted toxin-antitoxin system
LARLYANENFPYPVVESLRSLGHDVLTVQESGHGENAMPDDEVLRFAIGEGRAVVTLNRRDFVSLHNDSNDHLGIIVCTVDENFAAQASRIDREISSHQSLAGQLIRVNRPAS